MKYLDKILLIVLIGIVLFMLMKMNKTMNLQTTLLIGMAHKMGITPPSSKKKSKQEEEQEEEPTSEEDEEYDKMISEMTRISDKIKDDKKLTKKEKEYYSSNYNEELVIENGWEPYQEEEGDGDEGKGNKGDDEKKKRLKPEERKNIYLSLIASSALPKTVEELAEMFANQANLVPSVGNTHKTLKSLKEEKLINSQEMWIAKNGKKIKYVFYGLIEWFDSKNKLKKEFQNKIV